MRKSSLGPFPKTKRWREVAAEMAPNENADELLNRLITEYRDLVKDPEAIQVITYIVALVVCSRFEDPEKEMACRYGCSAVQITNPLLRTALFDTVDQVSSCPETLLFEDDPWKTWREFDGVAFCDLARSFFRHLNEQYFAAALSTEPNETVNRLAKEMSLITRSFSARWFNACARYQIPEQGSISWYLGHCLGKLELELERELSDWQEPTGNPWKRKRKDYNEKLALN